MSASKISMFILRQYQKSGNELSNGRRLWKRPFYYTTTTTTTCCCHSRSGYRFLICHWNKEPWQCCVSFRCIREAAAAAHILTFRSVVVPANNAEEEGKDSGKVCQRVECAREMREECESGTIHLQRHSLRKSSRRRRRISPTLLSLLLHISIVVLTCGAI